MASRDKRELRVELVKAYDLAIIRYKELYPNDPQPFITCTFRSNEEQNILFNKRPKVTNAKAGQSPHNFNPSFAFDLGFITLDKKMDWTPRLFLNFSNIITSIDSNIDWGGNWIKFSDKPHFELKGWKNLIQKK